MCRANMFFFCFARLKFCQGHRLPVKKQFSLKRVNKSSKHLYENISAGKQFIDKNNFLILWHNNDDDFMSKFLCFDK